MKKCTQCLMDKPEDNYYKRPSGRGIFTAKCKECLRENIRQRTLVVEAENIIKGDTLAISDKQKICFTCNESKLYSQFNRQKKNKDGHASSCRDCSRPYAKKYYQEHKDRIKEYGDATRQKFIKAKRDYYIEYLRNHPCVDCGESNVLTLQADHRENKLDDVSKIISTNIGLERLKQEVAKCDIRCANCHQIKTAYDFNYWRILYV